MSGALGVNGGGGEEVVGVNGGGGEEAVGANGGGAGMDEDFSDVSVSNSVSLSGIILGSLWSTSTSTMDDATASSSVSPMAMQDILDMPENQGAAAVIVPPTWCPHLEQNKPFTEEDGKEFKLDSPCLECGNVGENWMCLVCLEVHCSRYVQEHMVLHGAEKEHMMSVSFTDLSTWCYACESYVDNEALDAVKNALHKLKFGIEMPKRNDGAQVEMN